MGSLEGCGPASLYSVSAETGHFHIKDRRSPRRRYALEMQKLLDWLGRHLTWLGLFAIFLCVATWAIDLAGWVHPCVYCRTQRTAIGLLGLILLLPDPRQWWTRYFAVVVAFFGAHVSAAQIFLVVKSINAGEPFGKLNLFMAGGALFTLSGLVMLLFTTPRAEKTS